VKKTIFENAVTIILALLLIDITVTAIVFFNRGFAFPRSVLLIGFIFQFALIFIFKIIILKFIKSSRKQKNILIIAPKEESDGIALKLLLDKLNLDNLKYICNELNDETYKFIDNSEKIYIGNNIDINDKLDIIRYCFDMQKDVYLIPGLYELTMVNSKPTQINDTLVFKVDKLGLSFEQIIVKRIIDILVSFIALIIMSPVFLIVSMVIKLYDRGPILFKQVVTTGTALSTQRHHPRWTSLFQAIWNACSLIFTANLKP
jgi:hypothetical protein